MGKKRPRAPVSERALLARVNRQLAQENQSLRKHRSGQWKGRYYHVDSNRNYLLQEVVDLEKFARDMGALSPYEEMID